jgi:hypothetical protein
MPLNFELKKELQIEAPFFIVLVRETIPALSLSSD